MEVASRVLTGIEPSTSIMGVPRDNHYTIVLAGVAEGEKQWGQKYGNLWALLAVGSKGNAPGQGVRRRIPLKLTTFIIFKAYFDHKLFLLQISGKYTTFQHFNLN